MGDSSIESAGFFWREREGTRTVVCAPLEEEGFANAFSTRTGGVSPMPEGALNLAGFDDDARANIHENRRRFLQHFEGNWTLAACWQVHGAQVRVIEDASDTGSDQERCDSLITRERRILLAAKSADCVPVILGDARTGACASVHAGWRGTAARILQHALRRMNEEYGTRARDVRAAVGSAALGCCYEVGAEVIDAFRENFAYAESLLTPTREGHARIDLHRANFNQLVEAGVSAERIHLLPLCTMCRTDLFFSYRREKPRYGNTGRLLSVIGRK